MAKKVGELLRAVQEKMDPNVFDLDTARFFLEQERETLVGELRETQYLIISDVQVDESIPAAYISVGVKDEHPFIQHKLAVDAVYATLQIHVKYLAKQKQFAPYAQAYLPTVVRDESTVTVMLSPKEMLNA